MGGSARIRSAARRLARGASAWLSPGGVTVLVLGLALSLAAALLLTDRDRRQREERVDAQLRQAAEALPQRLQRTELVLRAAPGFAPSLPALTAADWERAITRLEVARLAPAVRAVMLLEPSSRVSNTAVPRWLAGASRVGARLRLVEPRSSSTGFLAGDGSGADQVQAVLARARDTGKPQISAPVAFAGGALPGTELFMAAPFYAADRPGATVAERRLRLRAWVAATFRIDTFLRNALFSLDRDIALEVRDVTGEQDVLAGRFTPGPLPDDAFDGAAAVTTTLMSRRWVVRATATSPSPVISWETFGLGVLFTLFVVGQLASRRRSEQRALALAAERTSDLQRRTDELQHQTLHDALTGLANRLLVHDRLAHALLHRGDDTVAVILIDLDRFKAVNDSYGHAAGDEVLLETARRLRAAVRPDDTVGRLGGDEFAVIAELRGGENAALLAQRIVAAFHAPMRIAGRDLVLPVSVGVAVGRGPGVDHDALQQAADAAMYRVKGSGGNAFALFDDTMHARALDRLQLETELRAGIDRGEIVVHYQPTVDAQSRQITGVEALARWLRADGLAAPDRFIGPAEESGLIIPLGASVLDQALEQACRWRAAGTERRVWVNVSVRQLVRESFVDEVRGALERAGADGALLGLEVTESALLEEPEQARLRLAALQAVGVGVAVDDFGTGYSSLERLKAFGLDVIKLDRSFVDGVNDDRYDRAIVEAVVRMAHGLDATLVAEGVETEAQATTLTELGCDTLQGYHFARPGPAGEIDDLAREVPA